MKLIKSLFTLLFFCVYTTNMFAHALFIETKDKGELGKPQNITIFYAEPEDLKKERIEDWWSDTKEFTLWLTLPNGMQEKLDVRSGHDYYYTAFFTPLIQGHYYVSIHHTVSTIIKNTQYKFNTSVKVTVGEQNKEISSQEMPLGNVLCMYKTDTHNTKQISMILVSNGKVLPETAVKVFAPNGLLPIINTNVLGIISFTPESEGQHVFEAFQKEEVLEEAYSEKFRIITSVVNFN
ncbi:hypothetical protein [Formosa sp. 4Alg 33]|uniref:hypothetical protein n=1 Tax=Formosa sp. 4Alg 33 TaxID=3382189 RepID=UPI003D9C4D60